jgi:hypothetical protein
LNSATPNGRPSLRRSVTSVPAVSALAAASIAISFD